MSVNVDVVLDRARSVLGAGTIGMAARLSDCTRVARIAVLAGVRAPGIGDLLRARQHADGGWIDIEETAWCAAALPASSSHSRLGMSWIEANRVAGGGWGRSQRDVVRVPTTGLVLRLHPEIGTREDWLTLEESWAADLDSGVALTYKGAMYLMCQPRNSWRDIELEQRTLSFLEANVNDDGGLGPWRGHPVGSDPWTTGVCLVGLATVFPDCSLLDSGANWLCRNQLASGHWRYHFIDEGTAYALWGLSEAARFLKGT